MLIGYKCRYSHICTKEDEKIYSHSRNKLMYTGSKQSARELACIFFHLKGEKNLRTKKRLILFLKRMEKKQKIKKCDEKAKE